MSSAPTPDEIARDATLARAGARSCGGQGAAGRDGPRQLSRRELPRRPHAAAAGRRAARAVAATSRRRSTATCAATRAGFSTSAMSARRWCRGCLASSTGCSPCASRACCAIVALSPPEVRERYIAPVPKLMSRTFAADEIACVKATSFVSEIAPRSCRRASARSSCTRRPRNYVASILAGENSVKELHALARVPRQRLAARGIDIAPAHATMPSCAAVAWACEMTALEAAAEAMADREIAWADFDVMLGDMPAGARRALRSSSASRPTTASSRRSPRDR